MKISVIIPTFNRSRTLVDYTLSRFLEQDFDKTQYEIIIIDDGSTDATLHHLSEFKERNGLLKISVLTQANMGPATARNRGLLQAQGDYVLFIGDDTYPKDLNFLTKRIALHASFNDSSIAILGHTSWDVDCLNDFMRWIDRCGIQFQYGELLPDSIVSFRYGYTCNLSFHRKWLLASRVLFDERFRRAAGEDIEFCYRLSQKHGMKIYYSKSLELIHHHVYHADEYLRRNRHYALGKKQMESINPTCFAEVSNTNILKAKIKLAIGALLNRLPPQQCLEVLMSMPRSIARLLHYSLIEFEVRKCAFDK